MKTILSLPQLLLLMVLVGCGTLYQTTITLTEVVDSGAREYARIFNQGLVSASVDEKVSEAHSVYTKAAGTVASALRAYKLSGNQSDYNKAFAEASKAATEFINLIVPFFTNDKAVKLKTDLSKASIL